MKRLIIFCSMLLMTTPLHAARSIITDVTGTSCAAAVNAEQEAIADAKRAAGDAAAAHLANQAGTGGQESIREIANYYRRAPVRILQELNKEFFRDATGRECLRLLVKAEVTPEEKSLEEMLRPLLAGNKSAAPLEVTLRTDMQEYRQGEKVRLYLKGNKPFFARIVYQDAGGNRLQLLPNPYRQDAAFDGGQEYEIPAGNDRYELEVTPPFGVEQITVYAGTVPPGELAVTAAGPLYSVTTPPGEIEILTRSIKPPASKVKNQPRTAEFAETSARVTTR